MERFCAGRDGLGRSIHGIQTAGMGFLSSLLHSCLGWSRDWFQYENPRNITGFMLLTNGCCLEGESLQVQVFPFTFLVNPPVSVCPRRGLDSAFLTLRDAGICC